MKCPKCNRELIDSKVKDFVECPNDECKYATLSDKYTEKEKKNDTTNSN